MPNKDSFTFSDKLRKSKSVPLSKRLPSIVGGQNKQKRTLVQRAQRDLPFILVAACALLLLPVLSRNGSEDIASPGDFNWVPSQEEPSYLEGGGADIMPAGAMTDPLDLILRPKSAVEEPSLKPEDDAKNAYRPSYDNDRDSYRRSSNRPNYDDRADYDRKYADKSKPSTIEKFGQKTRPSVRNSVVRKGTEINRALRLSQIPFGKGATGVSHALPTGQGPASTPAPNVYDPGVRPVALQPMEARGTVGRSLTGENLYTEAARSINAMNAGRGAKANLLAAQMKDVDGTLTPTGEGGAFGGAGSPRPGGAGGVPGNTNGYHIDKPWWWDMMQQRSQKWWELFQYKWRDMLWSNIYNVGLGIFNCLLTGDKGGDVSHFFGQSAGDADYICKGYPDLGSLSEFVKAAGNTTTSKNKDGDTDTKTDNYSAADRYIKLCEAKKGEFIKDPDSDSSLFKVRAKCLGLDVLTNRLKKWATAKEYKGNCSGVNGDPINFTYTVTKNKQDKEKLESKTVIALVAKVKGDAYAEKRYDYNTNSHRFEKEKSPYYSVKGQEIIVYAQVGNKFQKSWKEIEGVYYNPEYCEISKLIAFVPRNNQRNVEDHINAANFTREFNAEQWEHQNPRQFSEEPNGNKKEIGKEQYEEKEKKARQKIESKPVNNFNHFRGQVNAARDICLGKKTADVHPLTLDGVYDIVDVIGGDGLFTAGVKKDSYMECKIYPEDKRPNVKKTSIGGAECYKHYPVHRINIQESNQYSATILNPDPEKLNVYAVMVEYISGQTMVGAKVVEIVNSFKIEPKGSDIYEYSFSTKAGGAYGFNPSDKVRTDNPWNKNSSSSSTTNNTQAIETTHEEVTQKNEEISENCKRIEERCKNTEQFVEENGNKVETQAYIVCMEQLGKCTDNLTSVTYQGNTTSSSNGSEDPDIARGEGRIFWIITEADLKDFKLLWGDTVSDKSLKSISNASEFVEDVTAFDWCSYDWCVEGGSCKTNPIITNNQCYNKEENAVYYSHEHYINSNKSIQISTWNKHKQSDEMTAEVKEAFPPCINVCYDDDDVYEVDQDGNKTNKIGKKSNMPVMPIKQCMGYCKHNSQAYPCEIVEYGSIQYHVRMSETAYSGVSAEGLEDCSPIAWYKDDVYVLAEANRTLPLKLVTPTNRVADKNRTEMEIWQIKPGVNDDPFNKLKAKGAGRETMFELFPKITYVDDLISQAQKECQGIELAYKYEKASITPIEKVTKANLSAKFNKCSQLVKAALDFGVPLEISFTFNGYASTEGNTKLDCDGHGHNGYYCNEALSEDRNLALMEEIANIAKTQNINIGIFPDNSIRAQYGFNNTTVNRVPILDPYRYEPKWKNNNSAPYDVIFQSVAHGSTSNFGGSAQENRIVIVDLEISKK